MAAPSFLCGCKLSPPRKLVSRTIRLGTAAARESARGRYQAGFRPPQLKLPMMRYTAALNALVTTRRAERHGAASGFSNSAVC